MAVIPSFSGPDYAGRTADRMQQFDANSATRLQAELEARASAFGDIVTNIEKIANVSGSGALDPLANAYAGQKQPIFGTDYASMMDRLRQAEAVANIGRLNRAGTGGGGLSTPKSNIDTDTITVRDKKTGQTRIFNANQYDTLLTTELMDSDDGSRVRRYEVIDIGAPPIHGSTSGTGVVHSNPNAQDSVLDAGSIANEEAMITPKEIVLDGVRYDAQTGKRLE